MVMLAMIGLMQIAVGSRNIGRRSELGEQERGRPGAGLADAARPQPSFGGGG
jgi:iron(III) transport system permease protein